MYTTAVEITIEYCDITSNSE